MVKILIMTIQVNFVKQHKNSPELSLLKSLPLTYHHSHFLAAYGEKRCEIQGGSQEMAVMVG